MMAPTSSDCQWFSLRRMPTQPLSSQQVEVKVKDDLPAFAVAVQHQAKAPLGDALLSGDAVRHQEEVPEEPIITLARFKDRREVAAGNDQDVDGGLRVNVLEGHRFFVLVDDLGGMLPARDLTKETGLHAEPSPLISTHQMQCHCPESPPHPHPLPRWGEGV